MDDMMKIYEGIVTSMIAETKTIKETLDVSSRLREIIRDAATTKINEIFNNTFPNLRADPEGEEFE